jgi:hypothetical protein
MPGGRSEVIPAHEIVRYRGDRRALRDGCD